MKRERKTRTGVQEKYLKALKDLKLLIETYNGEITVKDWVKAYKLDQQIQSVLTKNGIIKNVSSSQKFPIYEWRTIEPNVYMVNKVLDELILIRKAYRKNQKGKPTMNSAKTTRHTVTKSSLDNNTMKPISKKVKVEKCNYNKRKISIFWGLIKIEK